MPPPLVGHGNSKEARVRARSWPATLEEEEGRGGEGSALHVYLLSPYFHRDPWRWTLHFRHRAQTATAWACVDSSRPSVLPFLVVGRSYLNRISKSLLTKKEVERAFWVSHRFDVHSRAFIKNWRYDLELNSIKDLFRDDNSTYSEEEILTYLRSRFEVRSGGDDAALLPGLSWVRGGSVRLLQVIALLLMAGWYLLITLSCNGMASLIRLRGIFR